jgi:hypothetical protein
MATTSESTTSIDFAPQDLIARQLLAMLAGLSFDGDRDLYKTLGYDRRLTPRKFRERYRRNGMAKRIVNAIVEATWRGGAEIIEDENPEIITPFEQAWIDLDMRLNLWPNFARADKLSRLGRFGTLYLGLPGDPGTPVQSATAEGFVYVQPFGEDSVSVDTLETETLSPRFGMPVTYKINRSRKKQAERIVHYTRMQHVAGDVIDEIIFGTPALECVWNLLDDLDKVTGGGAEAFWIRANQGLHIDVDKEAELGEGDEQRLDDEIKRYTHKQQRFLRTIGAKVKSLGSDVADLRGPAGAIVDQISAATGIPQRILMGSERGELASSQDRLNWDDQVTDRRTSFAGPSVVRPFIDNQITLGVLPIPAKYEPRWPQIQSLTIDERAKIAATLKTLGPSVITDEEIRDRILQLPRLKPEEQQQQPQTGEEQKAGANTRLEAKIIRLAVYRATVKKTPQLALVRRSA